MQIDVVKIPGMQVAMVHEFCYQNRNLYIKIALKTQSGAI